MGATKSEQSGEEARPVEEMSYTDASAELDSIVGFFEGREVDVDQLVGRLVRATAIIEELDKRLRRTRMQVEQLVPRLAAVLDDVVDEEPDDAGRAPDGPGDDGSDDAPPDDEPPDDVAGTTSAREPTGDVVSARRPPQDRDGGDAERPPELF
jgi:exodeoxyribonuclease VII small subunit